MVLLSTVEIEYVSNNVKRLICGLLYLAVCHFTGYANANAPSLRDAKDEFVISKWTTQEGLPQNTVTSLIQTKDGYIWIGTFGGLARFDGIKFTLFTSANSAGLTNNRITILFEDSRRTLWMGTDDGKVFYLYDGSFRNLDSNAGFERGVVRSFAEDAVGNILIRSNSGIESVRINSAMQPTTEWSRKLVSMRTYQLGLDPKGRVWLEHMGKFFIVKNDALSPVENENFLLPDGSSNLGFAQDGKIWLTTPSSIGISQATKYREIYSRDKNVRGDEYATKFYEGTYWFQHGSHLYELSESAKTRYDLTGTLDGGSRRILVDREKNLWIGTNRNGLIRLTRKRINLLSKLTDYQITNSYSAVEDSNGTVWVAAHSLFEVRKDGVSKHSNMPGGDLLETRTLAFDTNGTLFVGGPDGLFSFSNGIFTRLSGAPDKNINSLFFDRSGNIWIGGNEGVTKFQNGQYSQFSINEGLANNSVRFITQTNDGVMWIGTDNGISKIDGNRIENITTVGDLSIGQVREITEDADGTIWIGTYGGGIIRFKNGRMVSILARHGLEDNFISRILTDDLGDFWILGNNGIFAVSRQELNAVADEKKPFLVGRRFGVGDGMKSSEASGGHQPAGIKTRDGKLWFPMIEDMLIIDPRERQETPFSAIIENARSLVENTDDSPRSFDPTMGRAIAGEIRNLEIEYTALSLTKPENTRFYYKLEGLDVDWIAAGTRRTAFYPYLPSGNYRFIVKAVNAEGVWSQNEAVLSVIVAKKFWETWWFRTFVFLLIAACLLIIWRIRRRNSILREREQERFSKQLIDVHEIERERIASELHDGLGQHLLVIRNWALHGIRNISDKKELSRNLDAISQSAAGALEETRSIVSNLTPQNLKRFGLTEAINNMLETIENSTGIVFDRHLLNIDDRFSRENEISLYRIVQECLNNIIKHSESPRAKVSINEKNGQISIIVEDFGKGFLNDKTALRKDGSSGLGLQNIQHRAKLLGGNIKIESTIDRGTRILIRIDKPNGQDN